MKFKDGGEREVERITIIEEIGSVAHSTCDTNGRPGMWSEFMILCSLP